MANIALLGWGSAVWDPGELNLTDEVWHEDGPLLPIELAHVTGRRTLALALCRGVDPKPVFWTHMGTEAVGEAVWGLSQREGSKPENVGFLDLESGENWCRTVDEHLDTIREWATRKNDGGENIGVIIWSDLKPNFERKARREFNTQNVLSYLEGLHPKNRARAMDYIEKVPAQLRSDVIAAVLANRDDISA